MDAQEAEEELRRGRTTDAAVPPGARQFPCVNCAGPLLYMPGTTHLRCPYCGNENDIPLGEDDAYLKANDFLAALAAENEAQAEATVAPEAEAVHCGNCGADTTVSPDRTADRCPYCASPLSKQNGYAFKLNVQAVLPFAITAEQALAIYRKWLASRWFAPNDFTRRATRGEAMNGIYMPYWTYDAATRTWYTGQRGDAYFTTRMVRVNRNGRFVNEPQQVRQIRWRPASGEVTVDFDDVLVPASQSLPSHLQHGLEPWQLRNLKPFRQEFLSGFITETYQIPLRDGFEHAKGRMEPEIDAAIRRDIGGDEQRITSKRSEYSGIAFKHILLPVWLSAYRYSGTTYRFMINAQTGEVSGDRPWSIWKIAAAVVAGLALLAAVWYAMGDGNGAFPVFYDGISGTGISLP